MKPKEYSSGGGVGTEARGRALPRESLAPAEALNEDLLTMGSLNSINSIMNVIAPIIGTPILARVSHYPPTDLRVGATFFVSAFAQAAALILAIRHFRIANSVVKEEKASFKQTSNPP